MPHERLPKHISPIIKTEASQQPSGYLHGHLRTNDQAQPAATFDWCASKHYVACAHNPHLTTSLTQVKLIAPASGKAKY
jgi:hypothetical protein